MNSLYLILIYTGVICAQTKNEESLPNPDVFMKITDDKGISLAWYPLHPRNISVDYYQVFWKNATDHDFIFSRNVTERTSVNDTEGLYFGLELKYGKDHIQPCSVYTIQVLAMDKNLIDANTTFDMETSLISQPSLKRVTFTPTSNSTIKVEVEYTSDCRPGVLSLDIKANGVSKWNDVREVIPKFRSSETSFTLAGLYPYTLYNIEFREAHATHFDKASVITHHTVPGPVSNVNVDCTSKRSISVGWSAPSAANGIIDHYWVEVINLYAVHRELHRVQTEFTKANLQSLSPNTEYHFLIWAENAAGNGTTADTVPVTISC